MTTRESIVLELACKGFFPCSSPHTYQGIVTTLIGEVQIELDFKDGNYLAYPKAKIITQVEAWIYPKKPHIERDGYVCYVQGGSSVFDIVNPNVSIEFMLKKIVSVLDQPKEEWATDFYNELPSYWEPSFHVNYQFDNSIEYLGVCFNKDNSQPVGLWGNHSDVLNIQMKNKHPEVGMLVLPTSKYARLFQISGIVNLSLMEWPPSDYRHLVKWLKTAHSKTYIQLRSHIIDSIRLGHKETICIFQHNFAKAPIGLCIKLPIVPNLIKHTLKDKFSDRLKNGELVKYYSRLVIPHIFRFNLEESNPSSVFGRNDGNCMPLANLKILQIGCGTIGSNLAPVLAKIGAGFRGTLCICDFENLSWANISRHYLGAESVGKSKSKAMCEHLHLQFPFSNFEYKERVCDNSDQIDDYEVIIDTTGDETTTDSIFARLSKSQKKSSRAIAGFIYGPATAICVFQMTSEGACHNCLRSYLATNKVLPELPPNFQISDSCNSLVTRFSIEASLAIVNLISSVLLAQEPTNSIFHYQTKDYVGGVSTWSPLKQCLIPKDSACSVCGANY